MDEAEALSTKMGIMIKGGIFQCFGSSQHIKNKFGTGFVIELKIKSLDENELERTSKNLRLSSDGKLDFSVFNFDEKITNLITSGWQDFSQSEKIRRAHSDLNLYLCIKEFCTVFTQVDLLEKFGNYAKVRF